MPVEDIGSGERGSGAGELDGPLGRGHRLVGAPAEPQGAAEQGVEHAGAVGVGLGVDQVDRALRVPDGGAAVAGQLGDPRGLAQQLAELGQLAVAVQSGSEVDGELELLLGLGEGVHPARASGRSQQDGQRSSRLLRSQKVVGQLGVGALRSRGRQGRVGLERLGDSAVQAESLARQQLGVHGLLEQRVPEAVAVRVHDQGLVLDRGAQPGRPLVGRHRRDAFEEPVVDLTADQGGRAEYFLRLGGQPVDADREDVAERRWHQTGLADGHQLLDEERVALGPQHQLVDQVAVQSLPADHGDEVAGGGVVEWLEVQPGDLREAAELGQDRPQRMRPAQLVGAVGDERGHRLRLEEPREVRDQVERRAVGPVQVLDDQDHRTLLGELGHQRGDLLEQKGLAPRVVGRSVGVAGQEPDQLRAEAPPRLVGAELAGEVAQQPDQGCERQDRLGQLQAVALDDDGGRVGLEGAGDVLGQQA